jgi:hypothetical protein
MRKQARRFWLAHIKYIDARGLDTYRRGVLSHHHDVAPHL